MRVKNRHIRLILSALLLALTSAARAGDFDVADQSDWPVHITGLLDLRYAYTSDAQSWLEGGSNKLRYGGADTTGTSGGDRPSNVFAVPQASVVLDAPVPSGPDLHIQINLNTDPAGSEDVGVVEAYASGSHDFAGGTGSYRAGALIPGISWENPEAAWSTRYTLTPSAISSWVGEEVRVFGPEASWRMASGSSWVKLTGAVFAGADQTGWLLAARGWSLDDYQSTLNQDLPLPHGGLDQPFYEGDGRLGYYGRLNLGLCDDLVDVGGGWWDNNADRFDQSNIYSAPSPGDAWDTRFYDYGGKLEYRRWTVIGQYLLGQTQAYEVPLLHFTAWYVLASYEFADRWNVAGRYDQFGVGAGVENGHAWTGDLQWNLSARQRLTLEYIYLRSAPNAVVNPAAETDTIFQFNWRLKYG